MKKLLFSFIVVFTLVAQSVNAQTKFLDNFEDGNFSDWTVVQGSWQIISPGFESNYCLSSTSDTTSIIATPSYSRYGIYEVDYKIPERWQDFRIYIQKIPVTTTTFEPTAQFYEIGLHPKGGDSNDYIRKVINGVSTDLYIYSTSDSNLTETNTWTHAKIERLPTGELTVYINGKLYMSVVDNSITIQGTLLIGSWEFILFDNISYSVAPNQGENNLLLNPSFELFTETSGIADHWLFSTGHGATASRSTDAKGGIYSQRIDVGTIVPPALLNYIVLTQSQDLLKLRGKRTYRFSFWAKGKGRITPSIILNGYQYVKWGKIASLTSLWQFFQLTFTTPDTVVSIEELIRFDDNTNFGDPIESDDWVLIDDASLEGPLIEIERAIAHPGYGEPANTVAISVLVQDVGRGISSVQAEIESPDEVNQATVELFDDGAHADEIAGDKIFGNTWTTLATPMNYLVDIVITDGSLNTTTFDNVTVFSTITSSLMQQLTTDPGEDYYPSVLQTNDGKVWLFWTSSRGGGIWYKNSTDGVLIWSNEQQLLTQGNSAAPSATQSSDGRIWVFYHDFADIWYITSNDGGNAWSSAQQFTTDPSVDEWPNTAVDINGKVAVVWASNRSGNFDVFCRLSLDNGNSWSDPVQITTDLNADRDPAVAIDGNGKIYVVWTNTNETFYSKSDDNGSTWSIPRCLTFDLKGRALYPAIEVDSSGKMWLAFTFYNFYEKGQTDYNWDVYYTMSTDGANWSPYVALTRFVGYDAFPDLSIINNEPWVVWHSDRTVNYDIWKAILGFTQDVNPPPYVNRVEHFPSSPAPTTNDIITIKARVTDESAVENVQFVYSLNDKAQAKLAMYDDGNHNDNAPGDDIFGVNIGPYPAGTIIKYQVEARDIAGNIILAPQTPRSLEVIGPFVQTSKLLVVGDYKWDYSKWVLPYYTDALDTNGYSYDIWDCFLRGEPDSVTLNLYKDGAVIWFTPYGGAYLANSTAQSSLQNYLDSGGKLFITGQDIGASLKNSQFYSDYLHARFVQDNVDIYALKGLDGDPITDGLTVFIVGGDGANDQWRPDEIDPISPAVSIFTYVLSTSSSELTQRIFHTQSEYFPDGIGSLMPEFIENEEPDFLQTYSISSFLDKSVSSSGSGGLRVETGKYRVAYLGFGFEAISNASDRAFLMYSIMKWLLPSIHEAGILYVSPNNVSNLGMVNLTIYGFGFEPYATVKLEKSGYQDIVSNKCIVLDSTKISATLDLNGRPLGKWDIIVTNLSQQKLILKDGLSINEAQVNLWVDTIGRNQIRVGRESPIWITFGNNGNISAGDVILYIAVSDGAISHVQIDTLTDDRWTNAQDSFQYNSSTIWGIWTPIILPGEKKIFKVNVIPKFDFDSIIISSDFIRYIPIPIMEESSLFQITNSQDNISYVDNNSSLLKKQLNDSQLHLLLNPLIDNNPPKGAIIFVSPCIKNPFGHNALSAGDGKVYDFYLAKVKGDTMPMDFQKWKEEMERDGAEILDIVEPKGLNDSNRDAVVNAYKKCCESSKIYGLDLGKTKIGLNCAGAIEYSYEVGAGINIVDMPMFPFGPATEYLLSPAIQYYVLTGRPDFFLIGIDILKNPNSYIYKLLVGMLSVNEDSRSEFDKSLNDPPSVRSLSIVSSQDPNEKSGIHGIGINHSILRSRNLEYTIYFENVDSATAAAEEIIVSDTLSSFFDFSTFQLGEIQFGDTTISVPVSLCHFTTSIDLRPNVEAVVQIECKFDTLNGALSWYLKGADPVTGDFVGFLPPNKNPPEGEGHVTFTIKPKQDLPSGTQLKNHATIIFDVNPPMVTNEVVNTIDALAPSSNVSKTSPTTIPFEYNVQWIGVDDSLGSGLKHYTISVSDNGGPYRAWLTNTSNTSATFTAENGHIYRFYSIARDSVGNVETQPDSFDVMLSLYIPVEDNNLAAIPSHFSLSQNFPNPFNPETTIQYQLPKATKVVLEIYNILGQKVKTLIDEKKDAGSYKVVWDGRNDFGLQVSSGLYLFRLKANGFTAVKKAVILR